MSVPVPLEKLRAAIDERGGRAYLLTVADDLRPHAVHVQVSWEDGALVAEVGKRTAANAAARSAVSLLYPVRREDDYSLIVDGTATASVSDGRRLLITPTRAILHRQAAEPNPASSCEADCVPLLGPTSESGS